MTTLQYCMIVLGFMVLCGVAVAETPAADFSASPTSGTEPLSVTFTDTTTNSPTAWNWSYRNATTGWTLFDTSENPSFTFPAGTYDISLSVTNIDGSDEEIKNGYVSVTVPPPLADFSGTPVSGTAPLTVTFSDLSTNHPKTWYWAYRNATTGWTLFDTSENPSFTFPAGTYEITLIVTNAGGSDTKTIAGYIVVTIPPPVTEFAASPTSGAEPLSVTFTDQSANSPTSWSWAFRNASTGWTQFSTSKNPSFTFPTGTYDINLTAANDAGSDEEIKTGFITVTVPLPIAAFTNATLRSGNAPLTVTFTDQSANSPTSWSWAFRNASTGWTQFSTSKNPSFTFPTGTYDINLTAANDAGSDEEIKTGFITVTVPLPVAAFTNATLRSGNAPLTVTFTDQSANSPTSWSWAFRNASTGWTQFSTSKNPSFTFPTGTYDINLTATNAAGSDDDLKTSYISVSVPLITPEAAFTASSLYGTAALTVNFTDLSTNTPTSWNWSFGDGTYSADQNPVHTYTQIGTYTVSLNVTNAAGSNTMIRTKYIVVSSSIPSPPQADYTAIPCYGAVPLTVSFADRSINYPTGWAWFFGDETYTQEWKLMNTSPGWTARGHHSSVAMPDGSIVLMGGYDGNYKNDVWRSTDNGASWTRVTANAAWSARHDHTSVVIPDGSIVLTGGYDKNGYKNDVWRSTDNGASWTRVTANAAWSARRLHNTVVMQDGSIVLMGGYDDYFKNDVWRSTDNGASWTRMTASAAWSDRSDQTSVALPDGSIVLMGGYDGGYKNDVWRSTDNGASWTRLTASAGWSPRKLPSSVAMPDGSIVLMSGYDGSSYKDDVWRSTDDGVTWTQLTASAQWPIRVYPSSVVMSDGSIVLTGGYFGAFQYRGDTWRFQPVGSSIQNPTHTYTAMGIYNITLLAYNSIGFNSTRIEKYVTASNLPILKDRISVYKDGSWYIDMNGDGSWNAGDQNYGFGAPLWSPVLGDWNSDGNTEIGVYRDGAWYLDYDASGWWSTGDENFGYGAPNWTPVVGDWNGDGSDKAGAYKDGAWYLDYDGSGTWNSGDKNFAFGDTGWAPVVGKWTDGTTKIGIYKDGVYYIDYNGDWTYSDGDKTIIYGTAGSTAVSGDWNANNLTEVGTQTGNSWKLDYDGLGAINTSTKSYSFGSVGWIPVIGDWNNDGSKKIGIYLNGAWYLDYNGNGIWDAGTDKNFAFGTTGWIPLIGKWS